MRRRVGHVSSVRSDWTRRESMQGAFMEAAIPGPSGPIDTVDVEEGDSVVGELDEVAMISDVHVASEIILDENDPPPETDDDGGDFDDGASSYAGDAMDEQDELVAFDPPAEDHSVQQLTAHTEPVFAVTINAARPEMIATGGGDDTAFLWRAGEAVPAHRLEGHTDTVSSIGFSADGTLLATAGLDGTIRVWDAATGALVIALEGPTQGINWICWHHRGSVLLAGSEDATAWMWKLPEGTVMQIFSAHSSSVAYGCFANNGRAVVTASDDGTVRVWNPKAGTVDHCLHAGAMNDPIPISCLGCHPVHPVVLFGAVDGRLKLAHIESGRLLAQLSAHEASIESVGFCDCLQLAASGGMDGRLCIWDLTTFATRHTCMHPGGVVELRWLRDAPLLLSISIARELRLWDARSGECLQTLIGHHEALLCMEVGYTQHGIYVVTGADDKTVRLWRPNPMGRAAA